MLLRPGLAARCPQPPGRAAAPASHHLHQQQGPRLAPNASSSSSSSSSSSRDGSSAAADQQPSSSHDDPAQQAAPQRAARNTSRARPAPPAAPPSDSRSQRKSSASDSPPSTRPPPPGGHTRHGPSNPRRPPRAQQPPAATAAPGAPSRRSSNSALQRGGRGPAGTAATAEAAAAAAGTGPLPAAAGSVGGATVIPGAPRHSSPLAAALCQQLCGCDSYQQVLQLLLQLQEPPQPQQPPQPQPQQPAAAAVWDERSQQAAAYGGAAAHAAPAAPAHQPPPRRQDGVVAHTVAAPSSGADEATAAGASAAGAFLDAATTAALLPHLAQLGRTVPPSFVDDQALQQLLPTAYALAAQHLPSLKGVAAQRCLLALARLKYVELPALSGLLEEARPALRAWALRDTADLLVALARVGLRPNNAWLAAVMQEALLQLHDAPLPALSGLLWGLVQLGVRPSPSWMRAYTTAAAEAATAAAAALSPTSLAGGAAVPVPASRRAPPPHRSGRTSSAVPQGLPPQQLVTDAAQLLSALAEARLSAPPALSSALLAAAVAQRAPGPSPGPAVELLRAAGALQLVPGDAWVAAYCRAQWPLVPQYTTWQAAASVLSLGLLQAAAAAGRVADQQQQQQQQAPWSAGGFGGSLTFAVVFQDQLRQQQQQQQQQQQVAAAGGDQSAAHQARAPQDLSDLPDVQRWLALLLASVEQQLPSFAARELADLLRGLALLQLLPAPPLLASIMDEVAVKLPRFTSAGLASAFESSARLWQLSATGAASRGGPPQQQGGWQQRWWGPCLDCVLVKLPWLSIEEVRQVLSAVVSVTAAPQPEQQQQQQQQQQHLPPPPSSWVAAVASHTEARLTQLGLDGQWEVREALGALGLTPTPAWHAAWLAAAQQHLEAATAPQLQRLLECAAAAQRSSAPTQAWLSAAASALARLRQEASWDQQLLPPPVPSQPQQDGCDTPAQALERCQQLLSGLGAAATAAPATVALSLSSRPAVNTGRIHLDD